MLDKLEVDKTYIDGYGNKIKLTAIGERILLYVLAGVEQSIDKSCAKENWLEPPGKVKRAKYLYKQNEKGYFPEETLCYYKDEKEFRDSEGDYDYSLLTRLLETEREFDK